MTGFTILLLTGAACSAAGGQLLFRVGARDNVDLLAYLNVSIFAGLVLYGLGTVIWIYVLSRESLLNVYSFTALTFVLVYLGGVFILGEQINLTKSVGVFFVLLGLYLITRSPGTL